MGFPDDQVEANTRDLIDKLYREDDERICEQCGEELYSWEDSYESEYDDMYLFCSKTCKENWEEENKHEYISDS